MSAYAIAHLDHVDMNADIVRYLEEIDATLAPYSGRFLVHGGPLEVLEGQIRGDIVVVEFPDIEQARQWYASPAYQEILPLRTRNSRSTAFLAQGIDADHKATDVLQTAQPTRGCNPEGIRSTGGDGLFFCFAAK